MLLSFAARIVSGQQFLLCILCTLDKVISKVLVDSGMLYCSGMAAQGDSNRTCMLCRGKPASHFCNCMQSSTLFCLNCFPLHYTKYPRTIHHTFPIAALAFNLQDYLRKNEALEKGAAALRSNLDRMEQCSCEFDGMIQKCIDSLTEYRSSWQAQLQVEREELDASIGAAVEETLDCLEQSTEPVNALAQALWTLPPEELQVFHYSITEPYPCASYLTGTLYHNNLLALCERFQSPHRSSEEVENVVANSSFSSSMEETASLFAAVADNRVELYNIQSQQCTQHKLSHNFGTGGSYIQVDRDTLLCLGGLPLSSEVYMLDLLSLQLTSLASLLTPRAYAGVAMAKDMIYVFGGQDESLDGMNCCEKYMLGEEWQPLDDMQEQRYGFTPCTYNALIYLLCAFTKTIETFSPETELFHVLSISLPPQLKKWFSVSFSHNGELNMLTGGKQLWQWKIGARKRKFQLSATEWSCWSSQPPVVVDSLVLIATNGRVDRFSLESYTFI